MKEIHTYYLELQSRSELKAKTESNGLVVKECKIKQFEINKFYYQFVGKNWQWTDRNPWTDQQWIDYAHDEKLSTFIGYVDGSPAGYFELQQQEDNNVELILFGLAQNFIGKGYGGYFLSCALDNAWRLNNTQRVWLHTCSFDHDHALDNYKARGMTLYKTETEKIT